MYYIVTNKNYVLIAMSLSDSLKFVVCFLLIYNFNMSNIILQFCPFYQILKNNT